MLNAVHKQLLAAKLGDLLASSPLVLVYQTIGNVRSSQVAASMQKHLDSALPDHGVQAVCLKMKNTVAAASKQVKLGDYLRANNILVGWQIPTASIRAHVAATRNTSLTDLISLSAVASKPNHSSQPPVPSSSTQPGLHQKSSTPTSTSTAPTMDSLPRLTHKVVVPAIEQSLKLQEQLPVALLASFYQGRKVKLSELKEWIKLDEAQVTHELLTELDLVASQLVDAFQAGDALVSTLDQIEPQELLTMLDQRTEETQGSMAAQTTGA